MRGRPAGALLPSLLPLLLMEAPDGVLEVLLWGEDRGFVKDRALVEDATVFTPGVRPASTKSAPKSSAMYVPACSFSTLSGLRSSVQQYQRTLDSH